MWVVVGVWRRSNVVLCCADNRLLGCCTFQAKTELAEESFSICVILRSVSLSCIPTRYLDSIASIPDRGAPCLSPCAHLRTWCNQPVHHARVCAPNSPSLVKLVTIISYFLVTFRALTQAMIFFFWLIPWEQNRRLTEITSLSIFKQLALLRIHLKGYVITSRCPYNASRSHWELGG